MLLINEIPRRLYWLRIRDPVPEEYRGWAYGSPPVRPRAYLNLAISEFAYRYCDTYRDLWLRRNGYQPVIDKDSPLRIGQLVHEVVQSAIREYKSLSEREGELERLLFELLMMVRKKNKQSETFAKKEYRELYLRVMLSLLGSSLLNELFGRDDNSLFDLRTEVVIDGTPLGLSPSLRVDAFHEAGVVVEFKLGNVSNNQIINKFAVGLAGYALAIESSIGFPVDYGLLVIINQLGKSFVFKYYPTYLSAHLRRAFIDNRDDAIEVLMRSSPPPISDSCNHYCPFSKHCKGGKS